jgi:hypothetical protein
MSTAKSSPDPHAAARALAAIDRIARAHNAGEITDPGAALDEFATAFPRMLPTDAFLAGAQRIVDDQRRIRVKYGIESVRERCRSDVRTALRDLADALGELEAMRSLFDEADEGGQR